MIRCLLIEPNAESALNEEAGRLLLEDYDEYASRARMMTGIHAKVNTTEKGGGVSHRLPMTELELTSDRSHRRSGEVRLTTVMEFGKRSVKIGSDAYNRILC